MACQASFELVVTARDWLADTVRYSLNLIPSDPLTDSTPHLPQDIGHTSPVAGVSLNGYPRIASGPNTGVYYLLGIPALATSDVKINAIAMTAGSQWYYKQLPTGGAPSQCRPSDVVPFLPVVQAHEETSLQANSHTEVFRTYLNAHLPQAAEHIVSLENISALFDTIDVVILPITVMAVTVSGDDNQPGGTVPAAAFTCDTWEYF